MSIYTLRNGDLLFDITLPLDITKSGSDSLFKIKLSLNRKEYQIDVRFNTQGSECQFTEPVTGFYYGTFKLVSINGRNMEQGLSSIKLAVFRDVVTGNDGYIYFVKPARELYSGDVITVYVSGISKTYRIERIVPDKVVDVLLMDDGTKVSLYKKINSRNGMYYDFVGLGDSVFNVYCVYF